MNFQSKYIREKSINVARRTFLKGNVSRYIDGRIIAGIYIASMIYEYALDRFPIPEENIEEMKVLADEMFCLDDMLCEKKEDKIPEMVSEVKMMEKEAKIRGHGVETLKQYFYPERASSYFGKTLKDVDLIEYKLLEHLEKCGLKNEDKIRIMRDLEQSNLNEPSITLHNRLVDVLIMEKGDLDICATKLHTNISIDSNESLKISTLCDGNVSEGSWRIRRRQRHFAFGTTIFTMGLITLYFTTASSILFAPFLYFAIYRPCMYIVDQVYQEKTRSEEMSLPRIAVNFELNSQSTEQEHELENRQAFTLTNGPKGYRLSQVSEYPKE